MPLTRGLRSAIAVSLLSLGWSALVGTIAVIEASASGALSLLGFGITALIDAAASIALVWRFLLEVGKPRSAELAERRAERAPVAAVPVPVERRRRVGRARVASADRSEWRQAVGSARMTRPRMDRR